MKMEKKIDVDKLTRDTISKGGLLVMLYFDLHAGEKNLLGQLGTALLQKILQEPGVVYAIAEIDEPIELDGMFSSSVEIKVLSKDLAAIARICGNYSPFAVDIKQPDSITLTIDAAHDLLMNISTNNYELKRLIIEKVYSPQDLENFKKTIKSRVELGKKILENKEKK